METQSTGEKAVYILSSVLTTVTPREICNCKFKEMDDIGPLDEYLWVLIVGFIIGELINSNRRFDNFK